MLYYGIERSDEKWTEKKGKRGTSLRWLQSILFLLLHPSQRCNMFDVVTGFQNNVNEILSRYAQQKLVSDVWCLEAIRSIKIEKEKEWGREISSD